MDLVLHLAFFFNPKVHFRKLSMLLYIYVAYGFKLLHRILQQCIYPFFLVTDI